MRHTLVEGDRSLSVAGPDVRILQWGSFEEPAAREQPEDLVVEVGGTGDPLAARLDRGDPRQLLIMIRNLISLDAAAVPPR